MALDFLKKITVTAPEKAPRTGGGPRKNWNPIGFCIRVWKSGAIFPSQELVDRFNLEYGNKPAENEDPSGYALDIFSSADSTLLKAPETLIVVNVTSKADNKTDVFGATTYNEDGTPKSSVMDQGSVTFGKTTLLPMLKSVYGIELSDERPFVDLQFLGQDGVEAREPFVLPNNLTVGYVPKFVARGERKGEMSVARREDLQMYILYPVPQDEDVAYPDQAGEDTDPPVQID